MIKDRIITFFLVLIIILLLAVIGIFGYKVVIQGYSMDQVIEYVKEIPQNISNFFSGEKTEETTNNTEVVENQTNEIVNETTGPVISEENAVDLSALKNYTGEQVDYELTKQLMNLVASNYKTYLATTASNGDTITMEFSKSADQANIETFVGVINSYIAELEADEIKGTFDISFSVNENGNEVLIIDRNPVLN